MSTIAPQTQPPVFLSGRISVRDLALRPEFFDRRGQTSPCGAALVEDLYPETSYVQGKPSSAVNIHLLREGALRLFAKNLSDYWQLVTIDFDHARIVNRETLRDDDDLQSALSIVRDQIRPLLSEPEDARRLIPGLKSDASWKRIVLQKTYCGLDVARFHNLSHPWTGSAKGSTAHEITLGGDNEGIAISLARATPGNALSLTLSVAHTRWEKMRHKPLQEGDYVTMFDGIISKLDGIYLPISETPTDIEKLPRCMLLLAQMTGLSVDDQLAIYVERFAPSKSTIHRIKKGLRQQDQLNPIPVAQVLVPHLGQGIPV